MYQPAIRPDQVRALYQLKLRLGLPMTRILRLALDDYLERFGGSEVLVPSGERVSVARADPP